MSIQQDRRLYAAVGQCRACLRRREVYSVSRSGGGSYNRAGRSYRSSICGECATGLLRRAPVHAGASTSGFDVYDLDRIVASLGTPEAAEVFTAYRDRRDQDRARRTEQRTRART